MVVFISGGLRLKFFTSAVSSAKTIVVPGTVVEDTDLVVLLDFAFGQSGITNVVPTGFTQFTTAAGGGGFSFSRMTISGRIADSGTAGSTLTGMSHPVTNTQAKALAVFRGNKAIASIAAQDADGAVGFLGDVAGQTILSGSGVAPLIAFAGYGTNGALVDPRSFSPAKDSEVNTTSPTPTTLDAYLAWKIMNSTGARANVTVDMDNEGQHNALASFYLELVAA